MSISYTMDIKNEDIESILSIAKDNVLELQKFQHKENHEFDFYLEEFTLYHLDCQLKIAVNNALSQRIHTHVPDIYYGCVIAKK